MSCHCMIMHRHANRCNQVWRMQLQHWQEWHAAPWGGYALLIRQMRLGSEYLEAASACCSLEGVCNPSKQGDGEQGVVSVFCNHLGRSGNLHYVSKHLPKTAACLKPS